MRNTLTTLWEEKDLYAGLRVNAMQHATNGECIIGYDPTAEDLDKKYCIISLSDGTIYESNLSKEDCVKRLNRGRYVDQRILTKMKG